MSWLEFITNIVSSVAWPSCILLCAWIFRSDLGRLIPRVKSAGPSGIEFAVEETQKLTVRRNIAGPSDLTPLEDLERTPAIAQLETEIHQVLSNHDPVKKSDVAVRLLAQTRLDVHFIQAYYSIFGSQIALLKKLRSAGGSLSIAEVNDHFEAARRQSEVLDEWNLGTYMKFLQDKNLIINRDSNILISEVGNDFLLFLWRTALSEERPL